MNLPIPIPTHTHIYCARILPAVANLTKITAIIFYATTTAEVHKNPATRSSFTFCSLLYLLYLIHVIVGIIIVAVVIFALPCTK